MRAQFCVFRVSIPACGRRKGVYRVDFGWRCITSWSSSDALTNARAVTDAGPRSPGKAAALRPLGVDGRLVAVVADLDAAWFGFLGDRNGEPQHAVVVAGLDLVGVEILAQE